MFRKSVSILFLILCIGVMGTPSTFAAETKVNTFQACDQVNPTVAMDGAGNFVVAWSIPIDNGCGDTSYFVRKFDRFGNRLGDEFQTNPDSPRRSPVIAMAPDGRFVIVHGTDFQLYDSQAKPVGKRVWINSDGYKASSPFPVMDKNGDFIIAYASSRAAGYSGIYARKFNSSGEPLGNRIEVKLGWRNDDVRNPSISMDADGNYVIAWLAHQGGKVHAQVFDSSGNKIGNEVSISSYNQVAPSVAMRPDGGFVIVWENKFQFSRSIRAQLFDNQGTPLTGDFSVTGDGFGSSNDDRGFKSAVAAMDAAGNFVITWTNYPAHMTFRVGVQKYNRLGERIGNASYTTGDGRNPAIAMDADGDFVLVWQARKQTGYGYDIYMDRFGDDLPNTRLTLVPDVPAPAVGQTVCVDVNIADAPGLYSANFNVAYDPLVLAYQEATEGNFLNADGGDTSFQATGNPSSGIVSIAASRVGDIGEMAGSGTLTKACFTVISTDCTTTGVGIADANFHGAAPGNTIIVEPAADLMLPASCGYSDADGDGVPDTEDDCPDTLPGSLVDSSGCRGSYYTQEDIDTLSEEKDQIITELNDIIASGCITETNFVLTVKKDAATPIAGLKCYLFSETGAYLGKQAITANDGTAGFVLDTGAYKIRMDYMGYQFWTPVFNTPATDNLVHIIAHQEITTTVNRIFDAQVTPGEQIKMYLFSASGAYLGVNAVTDTSGQVTFNLPEQSYKVRADYLSAQYWSDPFIWQHNTITVNEGDARVYVGQNGIPSADVKVYVFNESGAYQGINAKTDAAGIVTFRLPQGTWKFRADYLGSQYWISETLTAHQVNNYTVDTNGGAFHLTLQKEPGVPMPGVKVYVFSSTDSYLGLNQTTDESGNVSFDLSEGAYKFRADYLGYQFWTDVQDVPAVSAFDFEIPHRDTTFTVNSLFQAEEPIQGVNIYLFKEAGSYTGVNAMTDASGQVTFSLPEQPYKVRADYLSKQYWSNPVIQADDTITIDHGVADVNVTRSGEKVLGATVYVFSETGVYLGKSTTTNAEGNARFNLPATAYKFRVDDGGSQYWSDVINLTSYSENSVNIDLDL